VTSYKYYRFNAKCDVFFMWASHLNMSKCSELELSGNNVASSCTEAKHERKGESGNERETKGRRRRRKEKLLSQEK
jgi:hypothetical protein